MHFFVICICLSPSSVVFLDDNSYQDGSYGDDCNRNKHWYLPGYCRGCVHDISQTNYSAKGSIPEESVKAPIG